MPGWWSTATIREAAPEADQNIEGRLWVRRDGAVLQQEATLFDSTIMFVRLADKEAAKLLAQRPAHSGGPSATACRQEHHD